MKRIHLPAITGCYWLAITLASVFGTNLGDFYAHESGLGIGPGLAILAGLAAVVFILEWQDSSPRIAYYWLAILIIRTGATNIADYLAFRVRIPQLILSLSLAAIITLFGTLSARSKVPETIGAPSGGLPGAGAPYWIAMLGAGVFGTVVGDVCSHVIGEGAASLALGALLCLALFSRRTFPAWGAATYWLTVAVARTAGTAMGDWFAENPLLNIGLTLSTLITGLAFLLALILPRFGFGSRSASV